MPIKFHSVATTVGAAVSDALGALTEIKDDCQSQYDSLPDSLQGGERGSTLEQIVSDLECADEDPSAELPDVDLETVVTFASNQRKRQTRSDRRDEAVRMLRASIDALRETETELREDGEDESQDDRETRADVIGTCCDSLEEIVSTAEGAEF